MILQVGIQRGDVASGRGLNARPNGGGLAAVAVEPHGADTLVVSAQLLQNFPRVVAADIVGDDNFVGNFQWFQRVADGGYKWN